MRESAGWVMGWVVFLGGVAVARGAVEGAGSGPLPPEKAAAAMTVPEGFHAALFAAEPDVVQPIAFTFDDRGRLWVAECLSYPNWNTAATPDSKGKDRIVILDDTNGDGRFDKRTVFADDLPNLSGLEVGFGGVYVCSMPFLRFIPADINADEPHPTGPGQVLLDGWNTKEAAHNVVGNLAWGPDGWLYGLNGIQSRSNVGKPGATDEQRIEFDCGVWRWHPTRRAFEVVCRGTTNPFGIDFDDYGQGFFTNCVIKHLWHIIPGAHYQRMHGVDYNPHIYQLMESCADHIHWGGGSWTDSRGGQGKHGEAGGGHAHVGAMIYLGDNWPASDWGGLFTCNLHGNRVNHDVLERKGSGYVAHHGADLLFANDPWFRGTAIRYGPDGGVFITDWTDTGECHNLKVVDRGNGRIYKVTHGRTKAFNKNLSDLSDSELAGLQSAKNQWLANHARRVLQERAAAGALGESASPQLRRMLEGDDVPRTLRALFALHAAGLADQAMLDRLLDHPAPYVRGWAIRLSLDDRKASDALLARLAALAANDPSPVVRLHLASALQRLPNEQRWAIAAALLSHAEDAADQNLPLMDWYGVEPLADDDPARTMDLLSKCNIPLVRGYIARRVADQDGARRLDPLIALLDRADDPGVQRDVLRGIGQALEGQRRVAMPAGWESAYARLARSAAGDIREAAAALALTFGDAAAIKMLRQTVVNRQAPPDARDSALRSLISAKAGDLVPLLHKLLSDPTMRGPALRGLAAAGDEKTPGEILKRYADLTPTEKRDAVQTLASRPAFAAAMLDAIQAGKLSPADVPTHVLRQMAGYDDRNVREAMTKVWGTIRPPDKDKAALIARFSQELKPPDIAAADPARGRAVFNRVCAQCHILFDAGGKVGPDLTGSQRASLDYVLENVLDPNAVVARDYQMVILDASDGRTLNGIIVAENDKRLTIRTVNEEVTLPKSDIAKRRTSAASMMPEGMLEALTPRERLDLIRYLASPSQIAPPPEADKP